MYQKPRGEAGKEKLTSDLFQFVWTVPSAIVVVERDGQSLLDSSRETRGPGSRPVRPLSESGLFMRFANLPGDEQAIVDFASEFGLLGIANDDPRNDIGMIRDLPMALGEEPLVLWHLEIAKMARLVSLWRATLDGDAKAVALALGFEKDGKEELWVQPIPDHPMIRHLKPQRLHSQSVVAVGWQHLEMSLNNCLLEHTLHATMQNGRLHVAPRTLLGALWLQFSAAVGNNARFRRCEQCHRWFEPGRDTRGDAKFCRGACRSKFYREKKEKARELHAKKVRVPEIAKQLDSDVETVKGWVKK